MAGRENGARGWISAAVFVGTTASNTSIGPLRARENGPDGNYILTILTCASPAEEKVTNVQDSPELKNSSMTP